MLKHWNFFRSFSLAILSVFCVIVLMVDLYHHLTDTCSIRDGVASANDVVLDDISIYQSGAAAFSIDTTGVYTFMGPDLLGVDFSGSYMVRENGEWRVPRSGEVVKYWGSEQPLAKKPGAVLARLGTIEF